jgi:hypothetical protein
MNTNHPFFSLRLKSSPTGSQFGEMLKKTTMDQKREDMIYKEVMDGNVPDFMKSFVEVKVSPNVSVFVQPDYMSIGSDEDFLRVPINCRTAQRIADEIGFALPTRKIVNDTWAAGTIKLAPSPKGPPYDSSMFSAEAIINFNIRVEIQRKGRFGLVVGNSKDVICSNEIAKHPENVVIYGWIQLSSIPIQQTQGLVHLWNFSDYSQHIRYCSDTIMINSQYINYYDALRDPDIYKALSDEGIIKFPKYKY